MARMDENACRFPIGGDIDEIGLLKLPLRVRPLLARPAISILPRNHDVMHLKRYDRSMVSAVLSQSRNLSNHRSVQLFNDFTTEYTYQGNLLPRLLAL